MAHSAAHSQLRGPFICPRLDRGRLTPLLDEAAQLLPGQGSAFHVRVTIVGQDGPVTPTRRRRASLAVGLLCFAILAAACTAAHPVALKASAHPSGTAKHKVAHRTDVTRVRLRTGPPRVTLARVRTADGSVITIAAFQGPVEYVLHDGSQDPGR